MIYQKITFSTQFSRMLNTLLCRYPFSRWSFFGILMTHVILGWYIAIPLLNSTKYKSKFRVNFPKCTVVGILFCNWLILKYFKWVTKWFSLISRITGAVFEMCPKNNMRYCSNFSKMFLFFAPNCQRSKSNRVTGNIGEMSNFMLWSGFSAWALSFWLCRLQCSASVSLQSLELPEDLDENKQ